MDIDQEKKMDLYPIYHQLNIAKTLEAEMRRRMSRDDPRLVAMLAVIARLSKQLPLG
jgi:hypothetical protein